MLSASTRVITKEELGHELKKVAASFKRGLNENAVRSLIEEEAERKNALLTEYFGVPASGCQYVLNVYAKDWAHSRQLYALLKEMGYDYLKTYTPLVCDGNGGSMPEPDPQKKFTVQAMDSSSQFVLKGKEFFDVLKRHVLLGTEEHAIYVYADGVAGKASISFSTEVEAYLCMLACEKASQLLGKHKSQLKGNLIGSQVKQEALDVWTVQVVFDWKLLQRQFE